MTGPERADLGIALTELRALRETVDSRFDALERRIGVIETVGSIGQALIQERASVKEQAGINRRFVFGAAIAAGTAAAGLVPFILKILGVTP